MMQSFMECLVKAIRHTENGGTEQFASLATSALQSALANRDRKISELEQRIDSLEARFARR